MAPRIEALKLPRSGLTETMRSLGASAQGQPRPDNSRPPREFGTSQAMPIPISPEMKTFMPKGELASMRTWRTSSLSPNPSGIRSEIQQIMGSGCNTDKTSAIFGCSPPSRAINPLSRDSTFNTGGRRSGEMCSLSVLYPPPPAGVSVPGHNAAGCT